MPTVKANLSSSQDQIFNWWDVVNSEWSFTQPLEMAPIADRIASIMGEEEEEKIVVKNPQLLRLQNLLNSPENSPRSPSEQLLKLPNTTPTKPAELKKPVQLQKPKELPKLTPTENPPIGEGGKVLTKTKSLSKSFNSKQRREVPARRVSNLL